MQYIGIDEVGRGAWAGPLLIVAARGADIELSETITDSKVLSKNTRQSLISHIKNVCSVGEGWVSSSEIDSIGLTASMKIATKRALIDLDAKPQELIIIDGHINYCPEEFINVRSVINADSKHRVVSSASIYAKVTRDLRMSEYGAMYPDYGFEQHVGYGTARHRMAIQQHGVTDLHRRSYRPIKRIISDVDKL